MVNAVRHAPDGCQVRCEIEQSATHGVIHIKNRGTPIPALHLPRLFDRFYRVDKSRSGPLGGSGLGLAIVQSIMALHNGQASATSVEGGWTTFTLSFPR
jgi:two-component system, OmpR family, heavy metal sensor histidine kinase CusS